METKYLRMIGITAVVLTVAILFYTMSAASLANRADSAPAPSQNTTEQQMAQQPQVDEKLFPKELAGMARVSGIAGQEAIDSVSQMHGTDIKVLQAYVVNYQGSGKDKMVIWIEDSKDEKDAEVLFKAMDGKMPTTKYFQNYKSIKVDGKEYKSVTSQDGMVHYYWLTGKRNVWVGITAANPQDMLKKVAPLF